MTSRDIGHNIKLAQSIAPAAKTTSVNGSAVDTAGTEGYEAAAFFIDFGTYTDGSHTFTFQDSADNSAWNNLAVTQYNGVNVDGVLDAVGAPTVTTNAQQNSLWICGYHGGNRYVRVITTVTGATTGAVYGAGVVLGFPHHRPAA